MGSPLAAVVADQRRPRTVGDTTEHDATNISEPINAPGELHRFLTAYRPANVTEEKWTLIAGDAIRLVLRAGALTRLRVEKDVQLVGALVAHLVERGRPVTLDEALSDSTLLSFDTSLQVGEKTRENKRGIARRLQAVHRGLPWRAEKRAASDRIDALASHTEVLTLHRILGYANATADDPEAAAFRTAVSAARDARCGKEARVDVSPEEWSRARRFAARYDWTLTHRPLKSCVTHETLDFDEPIAVLIDRYGLSRRDLDLALTRVCDLPEVPGPAHRDLLRGVV